MSNFTPASFWNNISTIDNIRPSLEQFETALNETIVHETSKMVSTYAIIDGIPTYTTVNPATKNSREFRLVKTFSSIDEMYLYFIVTYFDDYVFANGLRLTTMPISFQVYGPSLIDSIIMITVKVEEPPIQVHRIKGARIWQEVLSELEDLQVPRLPDIQIA